MQARVFGLPSTTTKQSKQTPIPQKTPRGSPKVVVRIAKTSSESRTVATLSPRYAVTGLPFKSIVTASPREIFPSSGIRPEVFSFTPLVCQSKIEFSI